jgi:hypothetical protein
VRLIDSHCHLNYEGLAERQDEVLENARARGVSGFLNISTRKREWDDVIAVAERNEQLDKSPEIINSDPYGQGWLVVIELTDAGELNQLMDAAAYSDLVAEE